MRFVRSSVVMIAVLAFAAPLRAADERPSALKKDSDPFGVSRSLRDSVYVVETDDASARESLDRISGQIDLGFAGPDDIYDSPSHFRPGMLGRADEASRARDGQY